MNKHNKRYVFWDHWDAGEHFFAHVVAMNAIIDCEFCRDIIDIFLWKPLREACIAPQASSQGRLALISFDKIFRAINQST